MRNFIGVLAWLAIMFAACSPGCCAEATCEYSVQLSVTLQTKSPALRLTWPQDHWTMPSRYELYRKSPEATSWGRAIPLPGNASGYLDTNVSIGTSYEYHVVKTTPHYNGYGY